MDTLMTLVERATMAPSTHNSQPWRWVVSPDGAQIELDADRSRALPASDPGGRELVMSCGAAVMTLRVAAADALLDPDVELLPDADHPDVLARVRLAAGAVDAEFSRLDDVVPLRRTTRRAFEARPVPESLVTRLVAEVETEGAHLLVVPAQQRGGLLTLLRQAERERHFDPGSQRELRHLSPTRSAISALTQPAWRMSPAVRLLCAAPLVVVLWTETEDRAAWLRAGQALQRMLLVAAEYGVLAGFLNAPCQVPVTRRRLAATVAEFAQVTMLPDHELAVHPQAVLRLGWPAERRWRSQAVPSPRHSRRRAVDEVIAVE